MGGSMAFTEYRFDSKAIDTLVSEKSEALAFRTGNFDFAKHALGVFERRLAKDPIRYRDYGPYWPALKAALNGAGLNYGANDDPLIRDSYCGETIEQTLVMADEFRSFYLETYFLGTNQFVLDAESDEVWTLFDPDMENRAAA